MPVIVCKYIFILVASIWALMTIYGKLFVFKKKHPAFVSDYCATMAVFLISYVILALGSVWVLDSTSSKFIMFGFAIAPFLIGLLATYHTEKYFTIIQVLLIILSIIYII